MWFYDDSRLGIFVWVYLKTSFKKCKKWNYEKKMFERKIWLLNWNLQLDDLKELLKPSDNVKKERNFQSISSLKCYSWNLIRIVWLWKSSLQFFCLQRGVAPLHLASRHGHVQVKTKILQKQFESQKCFKVTLTVYVRKRLCSAMYFWRAYLGWRKHGKLLNN